MSSRTNRNTLLLISVFLSAMPGTTFAGPLLFPFQTGVRYEYKRCDSANPVNEWSVRMEFDHTKTINDLTYIHLQRWNYENDSSLQDMGYVRLTEQALYQYNPTPDEEDYIIQQEAPVGTKWDCPLREGQDYLVREIIAIEPVTVPYGHFEQAYVQRVFTCIDPDDLNKGKSTDWYEWMVPGVGFVKQVNDWVDNPPATLELVRVLHEPTVTITLEDFFPLTEGITWNYLQTYQDGRRDYEIYCIGPLEAVNGGTASKRLQFDSGDLEEHDYSYDCMAWTEDGLKMYKRVHSNGSYTTYVPAMMQLPRMIHIGETFKHTSNRTEYDTNGSVTHAGPYVIELTLEGEEDVEVLAGSFPGCLRFSGTEGDEGNPDDMILWLAPGIGEVKRIFAGSEDRELISFTGRGITYCPGD
jgi:hypothetical protein